MSDESPAPRWDEPEQAPAEHDPPPRMTVYPYGHRPALSVLVDGRWLPMEVAMRADYEDGRVAYHGDIHLPQHGEAWGQSRRRAYWWPQPGRLKVAAPPG